MTGKAKLTIIYLAISSNFIILIKNLKGINRVLERKKLNKDIPGKTEPSLEKEGGWGRFWHFRNEGKEYT